MSAASYKSLYRTKQWHRLRYHQLQRQPLCELHRKLGKVVAATIVDHITPHRGDTVLFHDPDNLQSLCKSCHDGAKKQLEMSGTLRGCSVTGQPLDANHHWNRK